MPLNLRETMPELFEPLSEVDFAYSPGRIYFSRGRFDAYCVWVSRPNTERYAPKDVDYFKGLKTLGERHGFQKAYKFFHLLFLLVKLEKNVTYSGLGVIQGYVQPWFGEDAVLAELVFFCLYFGMVAEEKKRHTKLGAHIKHLGVHQILVQKLPVEVAANFSKGKRWQEILGECRKWGILYELKTPAQKELGSES